MSISVVSSISSGGNYLGSTPTHYSSATFGEDEHNHDIHGYTATVPDMSDFQGLNDGLSQFRKQLSSDKKSLGERLQKLQQAIDAINEKQSEFEAQSEENHQFKEKLKQEIVAQLSSGSQFFKNITELINGHVKKVQDEVSRIQKTGVDALGALIRAKELSETFQKNTATVLSQLEASVKECKHIYSEMEVFAEQKLLNIGEEYEKVKKLLASSEEKVRLFTETMTKQLQVAESKAASLSAALEKQACQLEATEKRMAQLEKEYVDRLNESERQQAEKSRQQEQTVLELREKVCELEKLLLQSQAEQRNNSSSFISRLAWLFRGSRKISNEERTSESEIGSEGSDGN